MSQESMLQAFRRYCRKIKAAVDGQWASEDGLPTFRAGYKAGAKDSVATYKAELLNEVGEPVVFHLCEGCGHYYQIPVSSCDCMADIPLRETMFFNSDQVAAAILKATKPLEEEVERLKRALKIANELLDLDGPMDAFDVIAELRAQLSAAQEEIERYKASPTVETCRQMIESQAVKENKILFDQLAKAEQRVAEACALACEDVIGNTANDQRMIAAIDCSAMINAGEWRKFVKEM